MKGAGLMCGWGLPLEVYFGEDRGGRILHRIDSKKKEGLQYDRYTV